MATNRQDPGLTYTAIDVSSSDQVVQFRGLYVGTSGNVNLVDEAGTTVLFTNVAAGMWHPMGGRKVLNSGTTASGLVGANP